MQRRRHLPHHPMHPHPQISRQGRQEPLQILPTQSQPNRHQDLPYVLLALKAILIVEEGLT